MKRIATFPVAMLLTLASVRLFAQGASNVPLPAQFASAKTAFLAYAGAPAGSGIAPAMVYPSAYLALIKMGNYRMTATPADADLLMEVSVGVNYSMVTSGSSTQSPYVRLRVYDPKTHALLWEIDELLSGAFRRATMQKNIDESVAALAADLKTLAAGNLP